MRNDSDEWMILIGEEPLAPRHIRIYEMMNWYEDIPLVEYDRRSANPIMKILVEEIQKEVNREFIDVICRKAKEE